MWWCGFQQCVMKPELDGAIICVCLLGDGGKQASNLHLFNIIKRESIPLLDISAHNY